jgi:hypothetical protein
MGCSEWVAVYRPALPAGHAIRWVGASEVRFGDAVVILDFIMSTFLPLGSIKPASRIFCELKHSGRTRFAPKLVGRNA